MNPVIPFASALSGGCREAIPTLELPHLERLLARLSRSSRDEGEETDLSMPHEKAIARMRGIEALDGRVPLAALEALDAGRAAGNDAFAWITPCHWHVATDHIRMSPTSQLQLSAADGEDVFNAVGPYFEEDGIALEMRTPQRWLARSEAFRDLASASLDRVDGRNIDAWIPRAKSASGLRRLQQETQMLLYTNEVNDRRQSAGLLPINSFWISGTGALSTSFPGCHCGLDPQSIGDQAPSALRAGCRVEPGMTAALEALRTAALNEDWPAWTAAWRNLDATLIAQLHTALDKGEAISLTLCGERNSQTWTSRARRGPLQSIGSRLAGMFAGKRVPALLQAL